MQNVTMDKLWISHAILLATTFLSGCGLQPVDKAGANTGGTAVDSTVATATTDVVLKLASTTSTRDTGLLDILLPEFERNYECRVDLIAVGSGAALKLGEAGDVDAVLVHARAAEEKFMDEGHGIRHERVMYNFFMIAGPADDPAATKGSDAVVALQRISAAQHRLISRGDDSGTHQREQSLWQRLGCRPEWDNFLESGQGMAPTLIMADEMNAYVLTDEGTWLKQCAKFQIVPLVRGAGDLKNPYSVIVVNPDKHSAVNAELADKFADFLISKQAQQLIANYEINGQQLFHADRLPGETTE